MAGLIAYVTSKLVGPIHSGIDVAPFHLEKDSNGLCPVDGMSVPVNQGCLRINANLFYSSQKTLSVCLGLNMCHSKK